MLPSPFMMRSYTREVRSDKHCWCCWRRRDVKSGCTIGMADTLSKKGRVDMDSRNGVDLRQVMITEIGVLFVRSCSVL